MPRILDPLKELHAFIAQHPNQASAARALGISQSYLCDLLYAQRKFSNRILEKLGLSRVVVKQ